MILANGTEITIGPDWCITRLPCGREVHAHPNAESPAMAERLGYGSDVAAMTRDHDPLHSLLADALGLTASHSLMLAAGCDTDARLAGLEEDAVLAIQTFAHAAGWEGVRP